MTDMCHQASYQFTVVLMVDIYHEASCQFTVLDHFASINMISLLGWISLTHSSGISIGVWSVGGQSSHIGEGGEGFAKS